MKKLLFICVALLLCSVAVFSQTDGGGFKEALESLGVSPGIATIVSILLLTVVGKLIPNKWADPLVYLEKVLWALYSGLHSLNESANNLSPKQRMLKEENEEKLRKVNNYAAKEFGLGITVRKLVVAILLLFMVGAVGNAQSPFTGFLKSSNQAMQLVLVKAADEGQPVTNITRTMFRPYVGVVGQAYNFKEKTTGSFVASGLGGTWGKFSMVNDKAYCNIAVNVALLTQLQIGEITKTELGILGSVGFFDNLFNVGLGYVNKSPQLLFGLGYNF